MTDSQLLGIFIGCLIAVGLEIACVIVLLIDKARPKKGLISFDVPPPKGSTRTGPPRNFNG